ncbi:hypothetical protein CR159_10085 [Pollutimonas subterranea]|uniref:Carboxymuconolactone decarboxylase-like domain-containing protein n=1 Tax=Pollutimonas subterranea TaxID=2045210 RepID=A0A2N4U4Y2_9BURK|nr:hypothetical protein CR159_10085 [Pollutimonas subterranea]
MTTHYDALTDKVMSNLAPLHQNIPRVMKGFGDIGKAAITDGALDAKTKELIALAIGVAVRCDGCIGFHSKVSEQPGIHHATD